MGGSSKKVTVGYKYYLGMHQVLCHGPADRLTRIEVDKRTAWVGENFGGRVNINAPSLFGGEEREGGVSGAVDILMGEPTQGKNDYLQARLGTDIPAFRGVVSAVLRQVYLGVNPYLKPWAFRLQRIHQTSDGTTQWYDDKAAIPGYVEEGFSLAICIDQSGSMLEEVSPGVTRMDIQVAQTAAALRSLSSALVSSGGNLAICGYGLLSGGSPQPQNFFRYNVGAGDVEQAAQFVENLYAQVESDTAWRVGMDSARSFFSAAPATVRRDIIFLTDGSPGVVGMSQQEVTDESVAIRDSIGTVNLWAIRIDGSSTSYLSQLDNTPSDGVPVVTSTGTDEVQQAILNALGELIIYDMNPAHIVRECLTNQDWGMGYPAADIDDVSFTAAADKLFSESMGISLLWDRQMPIEDFISEIIRHIDAALYVDRVSGKFVLKLIRDDYVEDDLLVLNESNITKVKDYNRVDPGDAINSVTVNFWEGSVGEDGSVTADDVALVQAYGTVVNTTVQYPGFTNRAIASRVAARDLKSLSSPLLSCTIIANREAAGLNIGDAFKFEWPDYHDGYVIMRVNQIGFGDGKTNQIKITASEDVYALPDTTMVGTEDDGWEEPGGAPLPPPEQLVFEAPYYELVQQLGQTDVDTQIGQTPEIGYLMLAASRPENGINARIWVDDGSGYEDSTTLDFCPSAELASAITLSQTAFTLMNGSDLDQVSVGTHMEVGGELMRIDSLDTTTGDVTVGRGILDTIPKAHPAGTAVLFWDEYSSSDNTEYVTGESVDAKVLTNSGQGTLQLAAATAGTVNFANRAVRPYRPANLKAETYLVPPDSWFPTYPVSITWVHRNRLQETAGNPLDWEDASVTPETGTQYRVLVEALDTSKNVLGTISDQTVSGESFSVTDTSVNNTYPFAIYVRVTLTAQRDGYDSWTSPYVEFRGPFREPSGLAATYREERAPYNLTSEQTA